MGFPKGFSSTSFGGATVKTTYHLWGQSNASGHELMANLQAEYIGSNANIQIWNGSAYENIDSTTNNNQFPALAQNTKFGSEFSFGKKLSDNLGVPIYLQKYAVGSTFLWNRAAEDDWNAANVGEYYDIVQGIITSAGDVSNSKAIIWIQGEADAVFSAATDLYYTNLVAFINGMRAFTGIADLKFICVLLNDNISATETYSMRVRSAMCKARETLSNVVTINTNECDFDTDDRHYNASGYDEIGNLLYLEETGSGQTPEFDKLLLFDSTDAILKTPKANIDTSVMTGVRPTFTIHSVFWINHSGSQTQNLSGLYNDTSNRLYSFIAARSATPQARLTLYHQTSLDRLTSNANSIVFGRWMSVSMVVDGTDSKVYINKVDETLSNEIDNTSNYGLGTLGNDWTLGQFNSLTPSSVDSFEGKIATWSLIDYAITKAEHDSLTGTITNNQIHPVKVGTVINPSNIVSLVEDNYSWNGSNIVGVDSWTSVNMVEDDISVDSPM